MHGTGPLRDSVFVYVAASSRQVPVITSTPAPLRQLQIARTRFDHHRGRRSKGKKKGRNTTTNHRATRWLQAGSPAVVDQSSYEDSFRRPVALRPHLSAGLPLLPDGTGAPHSPAATHSKHWPMVASHAPNSYDPGHGSKTIMVNWLLFSMSYWLFREISALDYPIAVDQRFVTGGSLD